MIIAIIIIILFLSTSYLIFFIYLSLGHFKHLYKNKKKPDNKFSVIIAARNESQYIDKLCELLTKQDYPESHYEIIFIDDRSSDDTVEKIENCKKEYNISIYKVSDYVEDEKYKNLIGKKRALQIGIDKARYELLAFTDADCLPSLQWLSELNKHFEKDIDFVAGFSPFIYEQNSFINIFKSFERISIFALCSASFGQKIAMTCTARNMAYRKENFIKVGGFSKIGMIMSGDDDLMLLMQRKLIRAYNFMFTESSIVPAKEKKSLIQHHHQEIRRASKLKHYPAYLKTIILLVAFYYLLILILFFLSLFSFVNWSIFIFLFSIKVVSDLILIMPWLFKMKMYKYLVIFPIIELFYIPYFLFYGLKGTFGKYRWKN